MDELGGFRVGSVAVYYPPTEARGDLVLRDQSREAGYRQGSNGHCKDKHAYYSMRNKTTRAEVCLKSFNPDIPLEGGLPVRLQPTQIVEIVRKVQLVRPRVADLHLILLTLHQVQGAVNEGVHPVW